MTALLDSPLPLAFAWPGGMEWMVLLVLGLLIFGRRLPEVGRSLGKGIVEFKRGIKGIEDEIESESSRPLPSGSQAQLDDTAAKVSSGNDVPATSTSTSEQSGS